MSVQAVSTLPVALYKDFAGLVGSVSGGNGAVNSPGDNCSPLSPQEIFESKAVPLPTSLKGMKTTQQTTNDDLICCLAAGFGCLALLILANGK